MYRTYLIFLSLAISACATHVPPPEADKSNLHPINTDESIKLIKQKVTSRDHAF